MLRKVAKSEYNLLLSVKQVKYPKQLEGECAEIEEYIEGIPDSLTRRIFRMIFVDGIPQKRIAKAVHTLQAFISKKISHFAKWNKRYEKVCYNKF